MSTGLDFAPSEEEYVLNIKSVGCLILVVFNFALLANYKCTKYPRFFISTTCCLFYGYGFKTAFFPNFFEGFKV